MSELLVWLINTITRILEYHDHECVEGLYCIESHVTVGSLTSQRNVKQLEFLVPSLIKKISIEAASQEKFNFLMSTCSVKVFPRAVCYSTSPSVLGFKTTFQATLLVIK